MEFIAFLLNKNITQNIIKRKIKIQQTISQNLLVLECMFCLAPFFFFWYSVWTLHFYQHVIRHGVFTYTCSSQMVDADWFICLFWPHHFCVTFELFNVFNVCFCLFIRESGSENQFSEFTEEQKARTKEARKRKESQRTQ